MLFECKEGKYFKNIIKSFKDYGNVVFRGGPWGLAIMANDGLLKLFIMMRPDWFHSFICPEPRYIAVNMSALYISIRRAKKRSKINFVSPPGSNHAWIDCQIRVCQRSKSTISVNTISPLEPIMDIQNGLTQVVLPSSDFKDIIQQFSAMAVTVRIQFGRESVSLHSEDMQATIPNIAADSSGDHSIQMTTEGQASGHYNLSLLERIVKNSSHLNSQTNMHLMHNGDLMVKYSLGVDSFVAYFVR